MKISVIGVTGLVGRTMLRLLEERGFGQCELIPVASGRSVGKMISFGGREYPVCPIKEAIEALPRLAIFSAGSAVSLQYAPLFAEKGTFVIDNSSAWRMYDHIPLVVPEINGNDINSSDRIIANPNCSTIQLVMALAPLHREYRIKRVVISTYQSVTGTGMKAVEQLQSEREGREAEMVYPHPIDKNVLPHGGDFGQDGYTTEEQKLVNETRKILHDENIRLTATVVRVPVLGGHSESVNIEFENEYNLHDVSRLLREMPGVSVLDRPECNEYPMPLYAEGKDEVFVGRIRRDFSHPNALNLWIVSDNLRKGAATNAVQIAQLIKEKFLL